MDQTDKLTRAAAKAVKATAERDAAIREAAASGMTHRAIAAAVGLSFQRVHQIIHSAR